MTSKFLRFITGLFGIRYAVGSMTMVVDGVKAVNVHTGFTPKEVWLNPLEKTGVPVCQADADWFSREIVPGGFVLLVKMSSEYRTVEWIAKG
jgi:hypothetical protein